jgi:N-acetylmuramoyl-L-alanine amidase
MTENSVITKEDNFQNQYDGFDPHSPEAFIIFSLYQNAYLDQSLSLAAKVQSQFSKRVGRLDRGVKQAGFLVLWKTAMPGILTEIGFMSNAEDAEFLLNDTNQTYMASALYRAFKEYKNEMEGNSADNSKEEDVIIPEIKEVQKENTEKIPKDTVKINNVITEALNVNNTEQTTNDTIIFRVQIASSVKQMSVKPESFKGLTGVCEIFMDGSYKYTFAKAYTFEEIVKYQKEIKPQYPDAFVIAIKNGKKIPVNEAIKQTKN